MTSMQKIYAEARARLAMYALRRRHEPDRDEGVRADAFAEARAIVHRCGGDHAEIMKAITPSEADIERARERRLKQLDARRNAPASPESNAPQRAAEGDAG